MAIPESQLETWSKVGSIAQSAATYDTIKRVLEDKNAPYAGKDFSVFLQGSYGNGTNVYRDSDVDVVLCLNQTYYSDTHWLLPRAKEAYEKAFVPATYGWPRFKAEVVEWLTRNFGADVRAGKKAIFIKGNGNRRDADVVVCAEHKRWRESSNGIDSLYDIGIVFWLPDGTQIVNFPKQHKENCAAKHQNTDQWFKPLVRVYKNMRNRMVDDGYLADGIGPSYFIEGMLWNVPMAHFGTSYQSSWVNAYNWIAQAGKTQLSCANDLHWLVRDNIPVCWQTKHFDAYLAAMLNYWNDWNA